MYIYIDKEKNKLTKTNHWQEKKEKKTNKQTNKHSIYRNFVQVFFTRHIDVKKGSNKKKNPDK